MKSLSLTGFTATIATGLLLNVGTANAIGIPVFDVSMVTQTLQNVLQHIQENSLIDGQKKEGTKQLQAMGNIRSMDGLKSFIAGAATEQVNAKFKTPKELSKIGLTDSKMKDPENIRDFLDNWHKKAKAATSAAKNAPLVWRRRQNCRKSWQHPALHSPCRSCKNPRTAKT